jgi:phenylalanyl-tRNA synthetase beta chain
VNVSVNWLRALAPGLDETPEELAERFTMTAAAVETVTHVGGAVEGIVVARAVEVAPHPNADRLKYCRVDPGDGELIDVVCGAPVVVEGALYPYVAPGVTLPGGFTIESRKLRGIMSHGMLCSEAELELGRDKGGIMRLADELEPGQPLSEALGLPDVRLSLDLNPNRVDLACHLGVARELAPGGVADIALPDTGEPRWEPVWSDGSEVAAAGGVSVRIDDPERCYRYLGAVVRGVTVGPSPAWLAGRLLAIGARPINNIVDATNYVLFELNQPIHAFDLATLQGPEISVRAATRDEKLQTLDGVERKLDPDVTVIADRERAVALAGIMGGRDTEVTDQTVGLFIECAAFGPEHVRRAAKTLTLPTDASYRFERGIDESALEQALARCVELILASAGGQAEQSAIRVGRTPPPAPVLGLRRGRVKQVLGIDPPVEALRELLEPIGFVSVDPPPETDSQQPADIWFRVPGWRSDVTREIDLVEEVARRYGYQNFPHSERRFRPSAVPDDPAWSQMERVRALLTGEGCLEARSSSFVPEEQGGSRAEVPVLRPLSAEEGYLRVGLVPVLLRRAEHNFARGRRDVRLFEIGTVFRGTPDGPDTCSEELRVGVVIAGGNRPRHWSGEGGDFGLWDLKGLATDVAERLAGGRVEACSSEGGGADLLSAGWLAAEQFCILKGEATVGVAGRVRADAVDVPPWAADLWALEFRLDAVELGSSESYAAVSAYPVVRRDLAVTVPVDVQAAAAEKRIRAAVPDLLEAIDLFDVYEGEGVESGRRSLAWAFRFRAPDRTLTDEDVETAMKSITSALESEFDGRVRDS